MKKAIMTVLALALMFSLAASGSDEVVTDRKPIAGIEIPITDIDPLIIGQVENKEAGTDCTVMICKDGMRAGLDVRGGGPAEHVVVEGSTTDFE